MAGNIYVFGGAGFLGKAFCHACPEALPCDSRDRLIRAGLSGVEFDFGFDTPDKLPCAEGDLAVIFSWRGYPAAHDADPVGKLSLNLSRTLELVSFLVGRGAAGIFYASSGGAIYGNAGAKPVNESAATKPVGFYGIGKLTAEMYVHKLCRDSGVRHGIFRIGNAYGIDQIRNNLSVGFVATAVKVALSSGKIDIWGDGRNRRDYIHSEDVSSGILTAICSSQLSSDVYNLGTGTSFSNLEVLKMVEEVTGKKVYTVFKEMRAFDVGEISLDCSRLRDETGWEPKWSLAEGIRQMADEQQSA